MQNKKILIIADDASVAEVLEAYLRRENYLVRVAADGVSGLEQAERWRPDLVLLDVMLPGLNGTEVLAKIRRGSDVPVIMVTAMGDTPDRIGALRYGADDYVVKPYHPGEALALRTHSHPGDRHRGADRAVYVATLHGAVSLDHLAYAARCAENLFDPA